MFTVSIGEKRSIQGTPNRMPGAETLCRAVREGKMAKAKSTDQWSCKVTRESRALKLEEGVFTWAPQEIACSLKRSAEASRDRKASPFRSAMSMLTFYINRAGKNLSAERRAELEQAKDELRRAFGKI